MSVRSFPVLCEPGEPRGHGHRRSIPWDVAERAYAEYARRYGRAQSIERLAERGGLSVGELDDLLPSWRAETRT